MGEIVDITGKKLSSTKSVTDYKGLVEFTVNDLNKRFEANKVDEVVYIKIIDIKDQKVVNKVVGKQLAIIVRSKVYNEVIKEIEALKDRKPSSDYKDYYEFILLDSFIPITGGTSQLIQKDKWITTLYKEILVKILVSGIASQRDLLNNTMANELHGARQSLKEKETGSEAAEQGKA